MKIAIWDTYVAREDGKIMHFDILVPHNMEDMDTIISYGQQFLSGKPFKTTGLSAKECKFCHMELVDDAIVEIMDKKGYFIIEMENCL